MITLTCDLPENTKIRLDKYLADYAALMTRSRLKQAVTDLRVNGKAAKLSTPVGPGDRIEIAYEKPEPPGYEPEELPLDIIYEDDQVIVLNKARGMVVHPAAGNHSGTLAQGLMHHISRLADNFAHEPLRPGIVHRLDKDTTGVLIAAKTPEVHAFLAEQFRRKETKKTYLAVLRGRLTPREGRVETHLIRDPMNRKKFTWSSTGGKESRTHYKVLSYFQDTSFVVLRPETGRTHQLRVHMLSLGHPILGDPVYGRKKGPAAEHLMLHAYMLEIRIPGKETASAFRAALPADFKKTLQDISRL